MPVDVAVRICLASSPLPPLLSSRCSSSSSSVALSSVTTATTATPSVRAELSSSTSWTKKKKKSVAFADCRGLALATVHVFSEAEELTPPELQFHLTEIEDATAALQLGDGTEAADRGSGLVLDFIQPGADYLDLRNRLKAQQVCLETCSVQDHLLTGTVQVRNLSFEKSVVVRISFDSWCSFQDVPCFYLRNVYSRTDADTFCFSILVPEVLQPSGTVEFCIQYQTQEHTFWDNNHGQNYRLLKADPNGSPTRISGTTVGPEVQRPHRGDQRDQMEVDPFGSPRTSAGIFPEWQSWNSATTGAPYW